MLDNNAFSQPQRTVSLAFMEYDYNPAADKQIPVHKREYFNSLCLGGFMLSINSGFINTCSILLSTHGLTITHNTGTTSFVGINLADGEFSTAFALFGLIVSFVVGSFTSGFVIKNENFHASRKYGFLFLLEGVALMTMMILLSAEQDNQSLADRVDYFACYCGAYAAGLQNALCTNLTGATVK